MILIEEYLNNKNSFITKKINLEDLIKLLNATHYLDMKNLEKTICLKIIYEYDIISSLIDIIVDY